MSTCEAVSDRMPSVASGQDQWTADEQAHLAGCDACSAEWQVVSLAANLGRELKVDAGRLAAPVLERVRVAQRKDRRSAWVRRVAVVGGVAIAAVLLLVVVPRNGPVSPVRQPAGVASAEPAELQLAELDDAAPAELEMVLVEFDEPAVPASSLDGPDLEGLDMSQVESALRSWEES